MKKRTLVRGERYNIIVNNQLVHGDYLYSTMTIFGRKYLFDVGVNERDDDGNILWKRNKVFKLRSKDILI